MRRNSVKLAALAAFALVGGAVGVNCSNGSNPKTGGDVKLAVVLPGGVHIDSITYKVQNSANATIAGPGSFSVTDPNATISLDIVVPVTPTGDAGDDVVLTATDSGGNACTGTSARFPVVAGTNPSVTMTLACGSASTPNATGNIGVTATVVEGDHCPNITSGVVAPDQTSVGGTANVAALATDADTGETLTYAWAPAGNFASATSPSTTYTCTTAGTQTFTLTVTDSHMPTTCSTQATFTIVCVATTTTGTGGTGTGGTGTGGTGTGGTGTGGTGTGGTGTGGVAGMGMAGTTGTGGVAGATGTGGVAGTTGTGGSAAIGNDTVACRTCELQGVTAGDCFNTSPSGQGTSVSNFGCEAFTGQALTHCQTLLYCLQGQACQAAIASADSSFSEATFGNDNALPCLCGTAFVTDSSGTAHDKCSVATTGFNGPCAAAFASAATDGNGNVTGNFTNNSISEGVAVNLMACDIDHPCTSAATCAVGQGP